MKSTVRKSVLLLFASTIAVSAQTQKKVQQFTLSKVLNVSAEKVWSVVGEDYGAIANSHPKILSSSYIDGSLKAEEGATRVCNFNEKGTKFLKEQMVNYNPSEMTFTNKVFQAGRFPVNPEYTRAIYKVEDLGNGKSKISFDMEFRTKPAFMGGMAKGSFKKLIKDYFIAIEHHAKTGEKVTKENFKDIKKKYS
ncbi:SRPBCC family protein [Spongiimicrobium sp. 3-5]|uniref:SRPBCC family protein n=1 Tax=Spongiimicrobium sp. 3-5 TaxID=3332596 RepID=UPI0039811F2A